MKHYYKMIFISLSLFSCTNDIENNDLKLDSKKDSLIINRYNIIQAGVAHSNSVSATTNTDALIAYQRMKLSESTPRITHRKFAVSTCGNEVFPTLGVANGSGILTSSNRITTAHHVVNGAVSYFDYQGNAALIQDHYAVRFGSFDQTGNLNNSAGIQDENPLLATRLFALGLDNWAKTSKSGVRRSLRRWSFNFDEENGDTQPFVSVVNPTSNPPTYSGQDVAVIKSKDDAHPMSTLVTSPASSNNTLESGSFQFYLPGPFFEISPSASFDDNTDNCPNDNVTSIYSSMFHNYPDTEINRFIPISGDGYQDSVGRRSNCGTPVLDCLGTLTSTTHSSNLVSVTYSNCVYSTLDAIPGCSGGGVFNRTCTYNGDGVYNSQDPIQSKIEAKGVISFVNNQSGNETGTWAGSPVVNNFTEPGNSDLTSDSHTAYTMFNEQIVNWAERDKNYDSEGTPFDPLPNQPNDDGCPGVLLSDGVTCRVQVVPSESTGYSSPGVSLNYNLGKKTDSSGNTNPNINDGDPNPDGEDSIYEEEYVDFEDSLNSDGKKFVPCFDPYAPKSVVEPDEIISRRWHINFGSLQGFIGTVNNVLVENNDTSLRVDSLSPVCVPWSSESWISNWSWARTYRKYLNQIGFDTAVVLLGASNVGGSFVKVSKFLFRVMEQRTTPVGSGFEKTVHSPSMKNCPPNYYLKGIRYLKSSGVKDKGEVVGITDVVCQPHLDAYESSGGTLAKPLVLPLKADNDYVYNLHTIQSGMNYDISPVIGLNESTVWTSQEEDICDDGFGAVAYSIKRNSKSNNIEYFHLYCAKAPKGGTQ